MSNPVQTRCDLPRSGGDDVLFGELAALGSREVPIPVLTWQWLFAGLRPEREPEEPPGDEPEEDENDDEIDDEG